MTSDRNRMRRRAFLGSVAAGTIATAGCTEYLPGSSGQDGGSNGTPTDGTTPTGDGTPTSTDEGTPNNNNTPEAPGTHKPMQQEAATFEDLALWNAHSGVQVSADSENAYRGSQSARVEGRSGNIEYTFPVAEDFRGTDFSLAFKVGEPINTVVRVALKDTGGNATNFLQTYYGVKYPNDWVRLNFSVNDINANMRSIQSILITIDGPGEGKKYWVDDLRFHDKPLDTGQVMFTFDFLTRSIYEVAFPIMEEYGLKGCAAVPVDRVGNEGRLTVDELKELDDAGWELASMTNDFGAPLTDHKPDIQRKRLQRAIDLLENWGFDAPKTLVYPNAACNAQTIEIAREVHDIAFLKYDNSRMGHTQSWFSNPMFVNRARPNTPDALENQLPTIQNYPSVFTIWHNRLGSDAENTEAEFREMCNIAQQQQDQGNINVTTPSQLISQQ